MIVESATAKPTSVDVLHVHGDDGLPAAIYVALILLSPAATHRIVEGRR